MKRQRHVLGTIAFALATAMATTAVAQDPSEAPTRKPATAAPKRAPQAPVKKAPAEKAPAEAAPADEAASPEAGTETEAAPEAAEAEAAEAEAAEDEAGAEAETSTTPSESKASTQATAPMKSAAAVPPTYYGPPELEYVDGMNIPPGYVKDTRIRKGMVIGGAVTWGVGWVLAATAASAIVKDQEDHGETWCDSYRCYEEDDDEVPGAAALYVPLLGPFIAMHTMRHDIDGGGNALLFLNGIMQATGFSLLVAGAAAKKTVLVRDPGASVSLTVGPGNASLTGTF